MRHSKIVHDLSYGDDERHKLDVYFPAQSSNPTGVVIYFHGGGYLAGDKGDDGLLAGIKNDFLANGIAVVSANYRFIDHHPFPAPMNDGTRVIQFVRAMAEEWNIDTSKIAVSGGSAVAHISLWNACKGNLAQPSSVDPIETYSSAVSAVITFDGQVSKDQRFYDQWYEGVQLQPNITMFYGIDSADDLDQPDVQRLAYEASAINFVSEHTPPVMTIYNLPFTKPVIPADAPIGDVIHHPVHGYVLKTKLDALGVRCEFRHARDPLKEGELVQFLLDCFEANESKR